MEPKIKTKHKSKFLFIAVLICAIIAIFWGYSHHKLVRGDFLFPKFREAIPKINCISIKKVNEEIVLLKNNDNQWIIPSRNDFFADAKNIVHFLYNVDRFRVGHVMPPKTPELFGLGDSTRLSITFGIQGKDSIVLNCGNLITHPKQIGPSTIPGNAVGRYYSNGTEQVFAVAQPLEVLDNGLAPWFSKELINIDYIATLQYKGNYSWSAVRPTPDTYFSFSDKKASQDESDKILTIAQLWQNPSTSDIDEFKNVKSEPISALKIKTFEGFIYEITFYLHKNRLYYHPVILSHEKPFQRYKLNLESGRSVVIPRNETEISSKLIFERYLSNWVYTIPIETYEFISRLRAN